jgi:hypothetical protein
VAVTRHHDGTFELVDNSLLNLRVLGLLVGEALAFLVETLDLLVDQLKAVVD